MIYELKKDDKVYKVDDNIFFDKQSKEFREAYEEVKVIDTAEFDNASVIVFNTGRIVVFNKNIEEND